MLQLPSEIIQLIIRQTTDFSVLALRAVNKRLHAIIDVDDIIKNNIFDSHGQQVIDVYTYVLKTRCHVWTLFPRDLLKCSCTNRTNFPTVVYSSMKHTYLPIGVNISITGYTGEGTIVIRVNDRIEALHFVMSGHAGGDDDLVKFRLMHYTDRYSSSYILLFIKKYFNKLHEFLMQ